MTEKIPASETTRNEPVLKDLDDRGVLTLTLNRPEKSNALNEKSVDALTSAFEEARENPDIKAVVLAAKGKTFCGGIDLKELAEKIESGDKKQFEAYTRKYVNLLYLMDHLHEKNKPLIGLLQGDAIGLGCTMALICDTALALADADKDIRVGYPERNFDARPWLSAYYAIRRLGVKNALNLFRSSELQGRYMPVALGAVGYSVNPKEWEHAIFTQTQAAAMAPKEYLQTAQSREAPILSALLLPDGQANQDEYDRMAEALLTAYTKGTPEERKELPVKKFTKEMCRPEVATAIRVYLGKHKEEKESSFSETTFTPHRPHTAKHHPLRRRGDWDKSAGPESLILKPPVPRDISAEGIRKKSGPESGERGLS
jgi:enoyl-CoA hydratase/carnithine racemase